jgi:hypothetical protein
MQLLAVTVGDVTLQLQQTTMNVPLIGPVRIGFSAPLDSSSVISSVQLKQKSGGSADPYLLSLENEGKTAVLNMEQPLEPLTDYLLEISDRLRGKENETFPGYTVEFRTEKGSLEIISITLNGLDFSAPTDLKNIDRETVHLEVVFSHPLDPQSYQSSFALSPSAALQFTLSSGNKTVSILNGEALQGYRNYSFSIRNDLTAENGFEFDGFNNSFFTELDSTYKFPEITDDQLLDLIQEKTFAYFYDFAHPVAGLARERNTSGDIVTIGGGGFGVMALIVGMERNFITREQGLAHLDKILTFLETCDRFHGAWPHWLNGTTGATVPFSTNDNGADLVETGFMVEGLMTMRQFLEPAVPEEQELIDRTNALINGVEWDWFTRNQNVLYWHWSPTVGWAMNMTITGFNEALIIYVLAASSTTHTIEPIVYHNGWARNGDIINGKTFYGYYQPVGWDYGGPLFFAHYSFLGLDPRNLQDMYGNYWTQNVSHSLINWAYCADNPKNHLGYSDACWGLTASDQPSGYGVHEPTNDNGTITPSAAVSSLPYSPGQSMDAIRHFYYILGDRLWGPYGFYDAFNVKENWWADSYIAIDQGPIICMIENYRSGLLWDLFMSSPEVQQGLTKLGFTY